MSVITIAAAVLLFLILIISHEFGHFAAAKLCGAKVDEFSIGMGPMIYHRIKGETEYSLRALPIGGYCKFEAEEGQESDDPRAFGNQVWWKKLIILAAGAFMNVVLAMLIMSALFTFMGSASSRIAEIVPDSPAAASGLHVDDKIITVNQIKTESWEKIVKEISSSDEEKVFIEVIRGHEKLKFESGVMISEDGRKIIGIKPKIVHSPAAGFAAALSVTRDFMLSMREFFARLLTGRLESNEVVGPVGIVSMIGESAKTGLANVIFLMCIISLNLGAVNLLPLPALDGGRILFVIIRAIFKGKISDEAENRIHTAGMFLLMALMLFLVFKDTIRLFK